MTTIKKKQAQIRIRTIRDVQNICSDYLGRKVAVKRELNESDGNNRNVFRLIVGTKQNPNYNPAIIPEQIFKGDRKINTYLSKRYGSDWTEKITKEDLDKCVSYANSKNIDTSRVMVDIQSTKLKVADVRVLNVVPNMLASDLIEAHLKGIKNSLDKNEEVLDKEVSVKEQVKDERSEDELAGMLEKDEDVEAVMEEDEETDFLSEDDSEDIEMKEDEEIEFEEESNDDESFDDEEESLEDNEPEEPSNSDDEDVSMSEVVKALNTINDNISVLDKKIEAIDIRVDQMETPKKKGRKKSK